MKFAEIVKVSFKNIVNEKILCKDFKEYTESLKTKLRQELQDNIKQVTSLMSQTTQGLGINLLLLYISLNADLQLIQKRKEIMCESSMYKWTSYGTAISVGIYGKINM